MDQNLPETETNTWMYHMQQGNFEAAWKRSDLDLQVRAGKSCWHLPRHFQHIWDGTPLSGKRVLVRCYHGLGDTIQFIRYMPLLKEIAAEVIVWAQSPLIPLLQTVAGIDQLLPLHDGTPEVKYDVDVEIMELPHIFRTTLASIPHKVPYLQTEPKLLYPGSTQLVVGLVWQAGDWDERRSVPFTYLKSIFKIPGITIYILQANAPAAGWQEGYGVYLGNYSLHDYAAIIKGLDLMITVDSMPAHLAGALGIPVWTLLHADPDWRWLENRDDSPWYPTMRLFRQNQPGNWESVITRVITGLKSLNQENTINS